MPFNPTPQNIVQLDIDTLKVKINAAIAQATTMNDTNAALTKDERQAAVSVGVQRKAFNDYYYANKNNYPALKPSQTVVSDADSEKHYFIHNNLTEMKGLALTLIEMIEDMQLNSEHFAYDYAGEGRLAAKRGKENGLPGADSFFDALDALFPQRGPDEIVNP
ncbi:MAG TPA: hypothetical protein VI757_15145 [Bacteroidia bacterium]|nr:hypothetical protein [Bacteroidia bacterium]